MARNKNLLKSSKESELYVDGDNIIGLYEMLAQAQSNLNFDSSQFIDKFQENLDLPSRNAEKK